MRKLTLILLLIIFLFIPSDSKDIGKSIQKEVRNTNREIKKDVRKFTDTLKIPTQEVKALPEWYPNQDGTPLVFPLKKTDYFMVDGKPVLSSWYEMKRSDLRGARYRAINIPARPNAPVLAIADGVVTLTGDARYFRKGRRPYTGMFIEITSKSGLTVSYEHLNDWYVVNGDSVIAGDIIGWVGKSGRTTGYHLRLLALYKDDPICISYSGDNFFNLKRKNGSIWHCQENGDANEAIYQ